MNNTNNHLGGYVILAIFCIISGILLLGENYGLLPPVHKLWPLACTFLGTGFILLYRKKKFESLLIGIGSYLIFFSILALVLNFKSWYLLKEAWPVFIIMLGLSLVSIFFFGNRHILYLILGLFLIMLSLVSFFVFAIDPLLWPLSLILFGISVLLLNFLKRSKQ